MEARMRMKRKRTSLPLRKHRGISRASQKKRTLLEFSLLKNWKMLS
jgi:hypothetical protein